MQGVMKCRLPWGFSTEGTKDLCTDSAEEKSQALFAVLCLDGSAGASTPPPPLLTASTCREPGRKRKKTKMEATQEVSASPEMEDRSFLQYVLNLTAELLAWKMLEVQPRKWRKDGLVGSQKLESLSRHAAAFSTS